MSEEQFDHIEHKIRQAADGYQPSFDEAAWEKMAALLDKESSRKRPFAWWWWFPVVFLLAGGVGYWMISKPTATNLLAPAVKEKISNPLNPVAKRDAQQSAAINKLTDKPAEEQISKIAPTGEKLETASAKKILKQKKDDLYINKKSKAGNSSNPLLNNFSFAMLNKKGRMKAAVTSMVDEETVMNNKDVKIIPGTTAATRKLPADAIAKEAELPKKSDSTFAKIAQKEIQEKSPDSTASAEKKTVASAEKKIKEDAGKKKGTSRFYFIASVGAEAASVKLMSFSNSRLAPAYGAAIGYQLTKKLSIQTGFYAGQKKYIAGPEDYKAKSGSYWETVKLKKVDATCMVYEIPLALRYTFAHNTSTEWFATVGISSYIMKKEDYTYDYIRYYMPYTASRSYTGNKHLLSTLVFSAGIDSRISNRWSIIVSPVISIPLSGVGDGSVKLFSAGIQAGIKFRPSTKR
jgi:hypothetical protein